MLTRPGEPDAQPAADLGERRQRDRRSPASASPRTASTPSVPAAGRPAGATQQRPRADLGLPAADRAAAARQAVRVDRDVADLAAVAGGAGERRAVDDQAAADADLAPDEQRRRRRRRPAPRRCSASAPRSASLANEIGTSSPSARARRSPSGTSRQPRFGRHRDHAVAAADDADDGDADPDDRCRRPARPRSVDGQLGQVGGDRRRRAMRPRGQVDADAGRGPSPPSPTAAAASESTAISRREDGGAVRDRAGRPARAGPGVPSRARRTLGRRSPPAASSPMSARIALRVRPVRATRSERDSGPLPWSSRTIALRFARRTVSLRCPSSSRPRRPPGL